MRRGVVASEIMVRITKPDALLSFTLTAVGIFMMRRGAVVFFLGKFLAETPLPGREKR